MAASSLPASAVPLTERENEDIERSVTLNFRSVYGTLLAKTGSTLTAGSPEWDESFRRTIAALLSGRPSDCSLALWVVMGCGRHIYDVPSWSMLPTILDRDMVSALKVTPARPVHRGDLIAYHVPLGSSASMHRVIGLPGDRVRLIDGVVELNGHRLPREPTGRTVAAQNGTLLAEYSERLPDGRAYNVLWPNWPLTDFDHADMAEVTVPSNRYFVMGDNRAFSLDSRFPTDHGLPAAADLLGILQTVVISREPARIGRSF